MQFKRLTVLLAALSISSTVIAANSTAHFTSAQHQAMAAQVEKILKRDPGHTLQNVKVSDAVMNRLHQFQLNQQKQWSHIKSSLIQSGLNENLKQKLLANIDQSHFANLNKNASSQLSRDEEPMNFLKFQIDDAMKMLAATRVSAINTSQVLTLMYNLAIEAENGTRGSSDLELMNYEFQLYKSILPYVQSFDLVNGEKMLTGDDLTIRVGDLMDASLNLTIPAFDPTSLGLDNLSIDKASNAAIATQVISNDLEKVMPMVAAALDPRRIEDAQIMLFIIPYVLMQDFDLYNLMHSLTVEAANDIMSDTDRKYLDMELDLLKSEMMQTQTYVSLGGVKMLGGGNIHIQMGQSMRQESTLDIELPVTDVALSGLGKMSLMTMDDAYRTLDGIIKLEHDLVYSVK